MTFDSSRRHRLSDRVGLRPEPFGALAYHYDTRRLVFLKSPQVVRLVRALGEFASADAAIDAAVDGERGTDRQGRSRRALRRALGTLHDAGVVVPA